MASSKSAERPCGFRLELIRWIDSVRHMAGWQSADVYRGEMDASEMEHESVGWVFFEDVDSIALCQSRRFGGGDDRTVTEVLQIPKVAIVARVPVGKGK